MEPERRAILKGLALLALLPSTLAPALAATASHPEVAAFQLALASFDPRNVLLAIRRDLGFPRRLDRAIDAVFEGVPSGGGLRAVQRWSEAPAFLARAQRIVTRETRSLAVKLAIRRAIRKLPGTADEVAPFVPRIWAWFGIDVEALRVAAATLPPGLLVVVGPPADPSELFAWLVRDPLIDFLSLVHGRAAIQWTSAMPRGRLFHQLFDRNTRVVCTIGHGGWDQLAFNGINGDPARAYATVVYQLRARPAETLGSLMRGSLFDLGVPYAMRPLAEDDLAALAAAWYPSDAEREAARKDLVVRYTCGDGRWALYPPLAADVAGDLGSTTRATARGIGPTHPGGDTPTWRASVQRWLGRHRFTATERPGFGTCLVREPADTRGYDGASWLPDFLEDPIPAPAPAPG